MDYFSRFFFFFYLEKFLSHCSLNISSLPFLFFFSFCCSIIHIICLFCIICYSACYNFYSFCFSVLRILVFDNTYLKNVHGLKEKKVEKMEIHKGRTPNSLPRQKKDQGFGRGGVRIHNLRKL